MILNTLNNKSVWKLLALFSYSPGSGYTRRDIMKIARWTNLSLDRALEKLAFYKVIEKKGRIIRLNFSNPETEKLMQAIDYEKKRLNYPDFGLFIVLVEFLRLAESAKGIDSIYLFGSHAKKTASVGSDIDIAVFSSQKINLIEAKDSIMQEYGKNIQIHYFGVNDKSKLVDEVLKHGVRMV